MIHHSSGKRGLIRRIFSMVIALLLVCSVSIPAFAVSEEPGVGSDGGGETVPTVTYNFYVEGELYHSQTVKDKETLLEPTVPVKEKEEFDGWYTAADGGEIFTDFSVQRVTETTTVNLYAGWKTAAKQDHSIENDQLDPSPTPTEIPAEETGEDVSPAEQPAEETKEDAGSMEQPTADNGISAMSINGQGQISVAVGETKTLTGNSASYHSWSVSDTSKVTLQNTSERTVSIRGVQTGTATLTHRYRGSRWSSWNAETITVNVTKSGSYALYIYTLIPGKDVDSEGNPDTVWNGMTVGSIKDVSSPTQLHTGIVYSGNDDIVERIDNGQIVLNDTDFPDIEYDEITYKYAAPGTPETSQKGYYTIEWIRVVVDSGANAGANDRLPVINNEQTYHLDGMLVLNMVDKYNVNFRLQDAGEDRFALVDPEKYSRIVDSGTSERTLTVPQFEGEKTVDGITYRFDGWYYDEECTRKTDFAGTITENTTYYAKYVPVSQEITVGKEVTGGLGDTQKKFQFEYRYRDSSGEIVEGSFGLKDGEKKTISDVPAGALLTLKETNAEGYTATAVCGDNSDTAEEDKESAVKIMSVTIANGSNEVVVTNNKDAIPDTGVHLNNKPYILMAAIVFAAAAGAIVGKLRKRFD